MCMRVQALSLPLFCVCPSFCYVESISITILTAISLTIYAAVHLCMRAYMYIYIYVHVCMCMNVLCVYIHMFIL